MLRRVPLTSRHHLGPLYRAAAVGRWGARWRHLDSTHVAEPEVHLTYHHGRVFEVKLNRPKAMNALSLSMLRMLIPHYAKLHIAACDPRKACIVVIKGAKGRKGPVFCAGGDVRAVCEDGKKGGPLPHLFFREEYKLNNLVGSLPSPHVAFLDGVTMGGGAGVSVHGKFRVATENTVFSMPETGIGFFTDVGGTHFLPKLGLPFGVYLGLTGARVNGYDAKVAGIATHYIPSSRLEAVESKLSQLKIVEDEAVNAVLCEYEKTLHPIDLSPSVLERVDRAFSADSVECILENLEKEGEWGAKVRHSLMKFCPMSCKVVLEALRRHEDLSLSEALVGEYRLSQRFMANSNFYEGVRAILIDRDNKPKWQPATLAEVTDTMVARYFDPLSDPTEELSLP